MAAIGPISHLRHPENAAKGRKPWQFGTAPEASRAASQPSNYADRPIGNLCAASTE